MSETRALLAALSDSTGNRHLANDPLSFCHRFVNPGDQEIAAVIASSFAYGAVAVILRNLEKIFSCIGTSPRAFVESFEPKQGLRMFSSFKHRFNDGRDLCALLWGMRQMLEQAGSVEGFFMRGFQASDPDIGSGLQHYTAAVLALDYTPVFGSAYIPADAYFPFLFPSPSSGSACKRLCMMLRWLVRGPDGTDLGIWKGISPSQLIMPIDTHICRIGTYLGFTARKQADWRMAQEITAALRALDPADPVRFDFALAHLGISAGCNGQDKAICIQCKIKGICRQMKSN